ncbi:MAG: hypothetical protein GVY18_14525 [Bacteroidetes bacterium]|jgi:hypothetical protein|nr:hypothetical protein [Bacteroidota bacterium]
MPKSTVRVIDVYPYRRDDAGDGRFLLLRRAPDVASDFSSGGMKSPI